MKANSILKRVLSTVLVMVMLFSCWVFTAPTANAANYTGVSAGKYEIDVDGICIWDCNCSGMEVDVYYKPNNGTGTEVMKNIYSRDDNFTWDGTGNDDRWNVSIDGFPTKVVYWVKVRKYISGTIKLYAKIYINDIEVGTTNTDWWSSSGWHSVTWTCPTDKYPKASTMQGVSIDDKTITSDTDTITVNGPTTVKDQYGTVIASNLTSEAWSVSAYKANNSSGADLTKDVSVNTTNVYAADGGYKAQGIEKHYLKVKCQSSFNGGTAVGEDDSIMTYKGLTATWNYKTNNSGGSTGTPASATSTVYFGDTPAARTDLTKAYYDNAQHHSGGTFSTSRMTADASFDMTYSTNKNHNMNSYVQKSNDNTNHTKRCSDNCGYEVNDAHTYSWTSTGGSTSDTHDYTCSKCGYKHSQKHGTHDISGQSYDKTDATNHWKLCKVCGAKIGTTAHVYNQTTVHDSTTLKSAATCTAAAVYYKTCVCGRVSTNDSDTYVYGSALGHDFSAKTVNANRLYQAATCLKPAKYYYSCSRCGISEENANRTFENGEGTGHTFPDSWQQITAEEGYETYQGTTYNASEYHKHSCITAGCSLDNAVDIHEKYRTDYDTHNWEKNDGKIKWYDNGDGTQCYKKCDDCGYKLYASHSYTDEVTAPTCTDDGFITHTCNNCGYKYIEHPYTESGNTDYKALGHDLDGVALSSDAEGHYTVCNRCHENIKSDGTIGKDAHTAAAAVRENEDSPDCTTVGSYDSVIYCSNPDCHYEISRTETEIAALGHEFNQKSVRNATTLKTEPTCTTAGEYYYTCSRCGTVSNEPGNELYYTVDDDGEGKALGHDFQIVKPELIDSDEAQVVYYDCSRCDACCGQVENDSGEYVPGGTVYDDATKAIEEIGKVEDNKVSTPFFNYEQFYSIPYTKRPSQMRYSDKNETNQTVRFVGNVRVPKNVEYQVGSQTDDVVLDFGFVWTQTKYICDTSVNDKEETVYQTGTNVVVKRPVEGEENQYKLYDIPIGQKEANDTVLYSYETYGTEDPSKLVIDGDMIQKMSVVDKNKKSGEMDSTASNWTGCTVHPADNGAAHYFTFNLVVSIKPGNWAKEYCARPYITYKYHGQTYTVYDAGTSNTENDGRKYSHESVLSLATKVMERNLLNLGTDNMNVSSIRKLLSDNSITGIDNYQQYKDLVTGQLYRDKKYVEDKVIFITGDADANQEYIDKKAEKQLVQVGSRRKQVYEWINSALVTEKNLIPDSKW